MRIRKKFFIEDIALLKRQALNWAKTQLYFCYLNGNNKAYSYESFPEILAVGNSSSVSHCSAFGANDNDWHFGFMSYEFLSDSPKHPSNFPTGFFFCPETIIHFHRNQTIEIQSVFSPDDILEQLRSTSLPLNNAPITCIFQQNTSPEQYLENVENLKKHVIRGDIYQINYCIRFEAFDTELDIIQVYEALNKTSPMPFSGLLKMDQQAIISASPERYLKKINSKIISQPMKGTAPRGASSEMDNKNKETLSTHPKERAENIMIVDLVRNDLSRVCKEGTVKVEGLCEVYSFPLVHQMVSTITGELAHEANPRFLIEATFPMGSMTGAPKISAMELISQFEGTARGPFSGALGYIEPNGNFDFNVLIRSIFHDSFHKHTFYNVGSGITALSQADQEYQECLLKALAIQKIFNEK